MIGRIEETRSFIKSCGAKNLWLIGFILAAMAQLIFVAADISTPALMATWILAPLLAAWVWQVRGPRLLMLALIFCWIGDVLGNPRQIGIGPNGFLLSVASFIIAIVCLIALFVQNGALASLWAAMKGDRRWRAAVALLYLFGAIVALWLVWGSLGLVLRAIAVTYLSLLTVMAVTALAFDTLVGVGAALFLGSEMLIALAIAGQASAAAITHRLEVLTLYALGILCITVGVVSHKRRQN